MSLFGELKRRNVFRVAALYLAVAWLMLQATDVLSSLLRLPEWVGKLVVLLLALGFIPALVLAWIFELTPEGIRRDSADHPSTPSHHGILRRLDVVTIAAVVIAIAAIVAERFLAPVPAPRAPPAAAGTGESSAPAAATVAGVAVQPAAHGESSEDALAVLPFENLSSDPEQEHFADGITEEILNLLANVQGLRVTSRTSAFSFKGQPLDLPTIARKLGVSYVVEGSVRQAGNRVRVTAQLIDMTSDEHIWSQSYDRDLEDLFAIQSDVAGQIAGVLKTALSADELSLIGRRPTGSLAAWQNFVAARGIYRSRVRSSDVEKAMTFVDAAIVDDPRFARAYSLRAALLLARVDFGQSTEESWASLHAALDSARHALELSPELGEPCFILAQGAVWEGRLEDADVYFRKAVLRAPNNADGRDWYGTFLLEAGYLSRAWSEKQRAAELDPLSPWISWQVAFAALGVGRIDVLSSFAAKARDNGWPSWEPKALEGGAAMHRHDFDAAQALLSEALPDEADVIARSFDAVRKGHIDAPTRTVLDGLGTYGPPGLARWGIEVQAGDLDAAFKSAWGILDPQSFVQVDGSGGPARLAYGGPGEPLRIDWWFATAAKFRADPRFIELVQAVGLLRFWREHGWPDLCQPRGGTVQCE
jgi:adenylate cyclase